MQYANLTDWPQERRRIANFNHDMDRTRAYWNKPICPDCMKPSEHCPHRKEWEFLKKA